MQEFPGTREAGNIGFALVDELLRTLVARSIISEDDVTAMLKAAADRMIASRKSDAMAAGTQIRDRMLGKQ
jgi:hypothetical protein